MAVRPRLVSSNTWARRLKEESEASDLRGCPNQEDASEGAEFFGPNVWQAERGRWCCGAQGAARALSLEETHAVLEVNKNGLTIVLVATGITIKNSQEVTRRLRPPILDFPGVPCVALPRNIREGPRTPRYGTLNAYFIKKGKAVQSICDPTMKDFHSALTKHYGERQLAALLGLEKVPGWGAWSLGVTDSKAEQAVLAETVLETLAGLPADTPRQQANAILTIRIGEVRKGEGGTGRRQALRQPGA
jgi:hypothetical protein